MYDDIIVCDFNYQVQVKAELDDIAEGLESLEVLSLIRRNPLIMKSLFIHAKSSLTCSVLQDLFTVEFSCKGSNQRELEEETYMYWVNFLQDVEGVSEITACMVM